MEAVFYSFSGIYESWPYQEVFREERKTGSVRMLDLSGMPGTDGYCDPEACRELSALLAGEASTCGLRFLDNGNYHYLSRILMEREREPFSLVVFDHHTDMQPPALLPLLSCGSWIRDALREKAGLRRVFLVGPPEEMWEEVRGEFPDRVFCLTEEQLASPGFDLAEKLIGRIRQLVPPDEPLYLSVDKDVLSPDEAETNWDQGSLQTIELLAALSALMKECRVLAMDVCGAPERGASGETLANSAALDRRLFACYASSRVRRQTVR